MKDLGMSLSKTKVTFENIKIVEESVTNNPADSGGTANLVSNSDFTLKNASLELNGPADQTRGSGMYLYQKSNLYVKDGSTVAVSGYNGQRASGIYADNSEYDNMPNRNIQVTGNSSIIITDCDWHGMTVNPIDILIDDNSKIDISQCGNASYGGGLGCYYGSVTISNHSKLITDDNNGSGWGVFANGLKVDATSSLSACNNKGCGAALASKSKIESGATVTLNENEKDGLRVYTGSNYWYGDVTIEEGANFTACENKDNGIEILPEGILDMQDGTVTHNRSGTYGGGLYNRGGTAKIGGKAVIYNNHADTAGDDIYSETEPSVSLSQVNNGWMLDDCKEKYQKEHPIVGWYYDGKEKRWNGDGEGDAYYAEEYGKEAVSEALKKHKVPESERHARIGNLFAHFDLTSVAREPASALDSEKRHLLAIAAALSFSPAAIVADEPTKGLDEVASARVAKALFSYDKQVVFATHDTDLIVRPEYAIGRVLVVDDHRVVFDGAPREAVDFYTDLVRSKYEAAKGDRA